MGEPGTLRVKPYRHSQPWRAGSNQRRSVTVRGAQAVADKLGSPTLPSGISSTSGPILHTFIICADDHVNYAKNNPFGATLSGV